MSSNLGQWNATRSWTINYLMVCQLGWISGNICIHLHVIFLYVWQQHNFTKLSSWKIKSHGACPAEGYHSSPPEEYESPTEVASERVIVIGSVAGGSLACTFALGFLFVCFNKRERRSTEKDCSSTTSMSPAATVLCLMIFCAVFIRGMK